MAVETSEKTERSVSVSTRFAVFNRDNFTCSYCGRKTPEVVLEIDHVVPVSKGGGNDSANLTTSCWECNRGKGATLLGEAPPTPDMHDQAVLMLERERQLKEYNAVRGAVREREEHDLEELRDYWNQAYHGGAYGKAYQPWEQVLRSALQHIACEDIKAAMTTTAERIEDPREGCRYLCGVLKNWKETGAPPTITRNRQPPAPSILLADLAALAAEVYDCSQSWMCSNGEPDKDQPNIQMQEVGIQCGVVSVLCEALAKAGAWSDEECTEATNLILAHTAQCICHPNHVGDASYVIRGQLTAARETLEHAGVREAVMEAS